MATERSWIFLHGTASLAGSFGELWKARAGTLIKSLFETYRNQVFAYQHRTLTKSPIDNALTLAKELKKLLHADRELHRVAFPRWTHWRAARARDARG